MSCSEPPHEAATHAHRQRPRNSGFSYSSTASDVLQGIDLNGKVAIVTGGYSGLGIRRRRRWPAPARGGRPGAAARRAPRLRASTT
jgi:hypothetical protein